jgi:hypothetical protein
VEEVVTAEEKYWYWWSLAHKVHHTMSATDDTFIASFHPICPVCNPYLVQGEMKSWMIEELDEPTKFDGNGTGTTAVATVTSAKGAAEPVRTTTANSVPVVAAAGGPAASPSSLVYKGVPLVWKSQESEPEHVFHWHDDPRKHPWCRKCQERVVPKGTFAGTPTERPAPPTPDDWSVKEVSA